jgi:deazaflavin-dependent oxidoreductase (nitroreductase family)
MTDDAMADEREFNKNNIEEFRRNGGKVGGQFEGFPLLLLTSTGAKSGDERVNLIGYFDIDDKIYIVGSAAGRPQSPAWVFNPSANAPSRADAPDAPNTASSIWYGNVALVSAYVLVCGTAPGMLPTA